MTTNTTTSFEGHSAASSFPKKTFNGPCFVKLLVNNILAGSIIGKSGSVIAQIESETGSSMKLSPANCYFPGTQDRIVVISGKQDQINNALLIIIDKLKESPAQLPTDAYVTELGAGADATGRQNLQLRMIVPKSCVSSVIGRGGQQIKQMQESTNAKVQISNREEGMNERVLTISGNFVSIQRAALSVTATIQSDPNLKDHLYVVYNPSANGGFVNPAAATGSAASYGSGFAHPHPPAYHPQYNPTATPYSGSYFGNAVPSSFPRSLAGGAHQYRATSPGAGASNGVSMPGAGASPYLSGATGFPPSPAAAANPEVMNHTCEIVLQIPDPCVGPVIGKSGVCLSDIIYHSGAKVRISPKGELVEGTNNRQCVIRGSVAAVHTAHIMVLQRLEAVEEQRSRSGAHDGGHGEGVEAHID